MKKLKCLIVEDEPLAAEILIDYIAQVPFLDCRGVCRDSIFTLEALRKEPVDVLFLDIHLPRMKGLDFIRTLKNPPQVIFITAYREYALEGFEVNAVDYLVKPVSFTRFLTAVNKLKQETVPPAEAVDPSATAPEKPCLLINVNKKRVRIGLEDILYIESRKEYICIVTANGTYNTRYQIGEIEQQLPVGRFIRIHRSFIVSTEKISAFNAMQVELGDIVLPIGRGYREQVQPVLRRV